MSGNDTAQRWTETLGCEMRCSKQQLIEKVPDALPVQNALPKAKTGLQDAEFDN